MLRSDVLLVVSIVILVIILIILLIKVSHHTSSPSSKYAWQSSASEGSVCSVPCGGGKRYLNVYCAAVDPTGKVLQPVDNSLCDSSTKPSSTEDCNTQPCGWITGNWGTCSQSCGYDGVQTRDVSCPTGGCPDSTKPISQQSCPNTNCQWTYSAWSPEGCAVCGKGTQTRTATCSRSPDSNCGPSDILSQPCTSANTCNWESDWLPYPPSMLDLTQLDNKQVKLVVAENQYFGLGSDQNNNATLSPVASAIVYTSYYIAATKVVTFSAKYGGQNHVLSVSTAYPYLLVNGVQNQTLSFVMTVQNGQIVAAAMDNATGEIKMAGTDVYYDSTQKMFYLGKPPTATDQSSVMNLVPLI